MAVDVGTYTEIMTDGWFADAGLPDQTEVFLGGWWSGLDIVAGEMELIVDDGVIKNLVVGGQIQDYYITVLS